MTQRNNKCSCDSPRIMSLTAKCRGDCFLSLDRKDIVGDIPDNLNVGGGNCVNFNVCAECGYMFGIWPLPFYESDDSYNSDDSDVSTKTNSYSTPIYHFP